MVLGGVVNLYHNNALADGLSFASNSCRNFDGGEYEEGDDKKVEYCLQEHAPVQSQCAWSSDGDGDNYDDGDGDKVMAMAMVIALLV